MMGQVIDIRAIKAKRRMTNTDVKKYLNRLDKRLNNDDLRPCEADIASFLRKLAVCSKQMKN